MTEVAPTNKQRAKRAHDALVPIMLPVVRAFNVPDQVRELMRNAMHLLNQAGMNADTVCKEAYAVFLKDIEGASLAAHPPQAPAKVELQPEPKLECEDCEWEGSQEELDAIRDIDSRVSAGEFMPAGECPECGALVHLPDSHVPEYTLQSALRIAAERGIKLEVS